MNLAVVLRTTWAVAQVLKDRGLAGSRVVVGGDARHGSETFALAAAEVLRRARLHGDVVVRRGADSRDGVRRPPSRRSAGIQITASHNPPSDNGYKVYFDSGIQIVPPDRSRNRGDDRQGPACRPDSEGGGRDVGPRPDPALCRSRLACSANARIGAAGLHADARCRRRVRTRRVRPGGIVRRSGCRESVRARSGLSHRSVPESGGTGRRPTNCSNSRPTPKPRSPSPWIPTPTGARSGCRRPMAGAC